MKRSRDCLSDGEKEEENVKKIDNDDRGAELEVAEVIEEDDSSDESLEEKKADEDDDESFEEEDDHYISCSPNAKSTVLGEKMAKLLGKIEGMKCARTFAVSEPVRDAPFTFIRLKDGTPLRFPILEEDLVNLIPKFEVSAYGRGEETIVDTNVRNSWELNPGEFEIQNENWDRFLSQSITSKITERFGIADSFVAKPHKLLMYKTNSFFKPHRDSEKEDGMFGTLVVQLPSKFTGGELIVCHDGSKKTFDHSSKTDGAELLTYYSAFYCDCEHEVRPLLSGVRVCLVYNLVLTRTGSNNLPQAASATKAKKIFKNILKYWRHCRNEGSELKLKHDSPSLVILLSHQYSSDSLHYQNLKGADKAVANFLLEMVEECEIIALLGIMEKSKLTNENYGDDEDEDEEYRPVIRITHPRILLMDKDFASLGGKSSFLFNSGSIGRKSSQEIDMIPKRRVEGLKPYHEACILGSMPLEENLDDIHYIL